MSPGMTNNTAETPQIIIFETFQLFSQDTETIPWDGMTKLQKVNNHSGFLWRNYVPKFFHPIYLVIIVDIQRNQDRISHALVLGRKANLFLIKVGKNKLLSSGTNTKLFCDTIGNRNITLNIIHVSLTQTKLL